MQLDSPFLTLRKRAFLLLFSCWRLVVFLQVFGGYSCVRTLSTLLTGHGSYNAVFVSLCPGVCHVDLNDSSCSPTLTAYCLP